MINGQKLGGDKTLENMIAVADQQAAATMGMRLGIAAQILAPLAAQEYNRAFNVAINEAYPNGVEFGQQLDMSKLHINFNFPLQVQVALGVTDMLLSAVSGKRPA